MASRHLGALYMTKPVSIAYLTGFEANPHERLMALTVRADGATLIVPALEEENAKHHASNADIVAWRDGQDPYELVKRSVGALSELGVEKEHLTLLAAERLTSRTGAVELVDVGPELRRLRLIKRGDELAQLQRAADITDEAYERVVGLMRAGQSEVDVALLIASSIGDLGGTLAFRPLVQSGPNCAEPHFEASGRKLSPGDLVLLDFGGAFHSYKADTTRMVVVGKPDHRQEEIHALVLAAHDAAIDAVRAGVTSGDVDSAARQVIERGGYGPQFFHRIGHGLGLEDHEDPSMDPGSDTVLEAGMVFTIEPGVYIPGWGGVRIEDDVVVEDGGCRVLTKADRSLRVIPPDR